MGRRLILDGRTLVAYGRRAFDVAALDEDDLAVAAVTVAEFRAGIELADSATRSADRARVLDAILSAVTVLDYTEDTAAQHARLLAHVRRAGAPRGAHDLVVASHAAQTGRSVLSVHARARFHGLPGVAAIMAPVTP